MMAETLLRFLITFRLAIKKGIHLLLEPIQYKQPRIQKT